MKNIEKIAKTDKIHVVFGGFYPRSRKVFGFGGGVERDGERLGTAASRLIRVRERFKA